jgi:hypothetical protein
MGIKNNMKYASFWWYALIEVSLLAWVIKCLIYDEYLLVAVILILIELREIRYKLNKPSNDKVITGE